jgi:hypothetical protein
MSCETILTLSIYILKKRKITYIMRLSRANTRYYQHVYDLVCETLLCAIEATRITGTVSVLIMSPDFVSE